jgi:hypothetical protein
MSTGSISLTCGEADGEDEVKERTSARFTLLKLMLADRTLTYSEFKVCVDLLMIRYNAHTGQCNPGVSRIAEDCSIDIRTAKRALVKLRDVSQYLVFESTKGGYKTDTTNDYEFRSPPVAPRPPVTSTPKLTSGGHVQTSGVQTTGTSGGHVHSPVVPTPPKHEVSNKNLNTKYNSNVPLPSVADTLDVRKGSGGEKGKEANGSKKASTEEAREARKPAVITPSEVPPPSIVIPPIERIEDGVVHLVIRDDEARLYALEFHDQLLARLKYERPHEQITKLSIPRNGFHRGATQ